MLSFRPNDLGADELLWAVAAQSPKYNICLLIAIIVVVLGYQSRPLGPLSMALVYLSTWYVFHFVTVAFDWSSRANTSAGL